MDNKTVNLLALIVSVITGWNAITSFINSALTGFRNWWGTLTPLAQIILIGIVFYLLTKTKK